MGGVVMAHFAELDETNTVLQIVSVHNDITYLNDVEHEQRGIDFLNDLFPDSGTWVQTSFNSDLRYNYAAVGYTYDAGRNAFLGPQPFPSWELDTDTMRWEPPTPEPSGTVILTIDGVDKEFPAIYEWDEDSLSWIKIEVE